MSFLDNIKFKFQSTNISFAKSKTAGESCNDKHIIVFDSIINGKKEALADMDYLDDYTDQYKQYKDEDNISICSDDKFQKINSYVFLVPSRSESSVIDELTGIF